MLEKSNEYNLSLCIGFIDHKRAFDPEEHVAIFKVSRKTNIHETDVKVYKNLQPSYSKENIYRQATARTHSNNLVSDKFPIYRGVRQGDPLSPKLLAAVMEEVFKKADISKGINVDGENLANLRLVDYVAFFNEKPKQMGKNEQSELRKSERWPKNTQGQDKQHDNHADIEDIIYYMVGATKKGEKLTEYKYLGQTIHLNDTIKKKKKEIL